MKTKLVIADLTRMQRGKVCIAGYDRSKRAVRPVLPPPGIPEASLVRDDKAVIFPFALVEFDLLEAQPQPPHTEDVLFDPESPRLVRTVQSREEVLRWSLFECVEDVFGQAVLAGPGHYVLDCQGPRSLGTIQPAEVAEVIYAAGDEEGTWDYRLSFLDGQNQRFRLKITDLTWHYYCDSLRGEENQPEQIAARLTEKLRASKVYLRIGLARGWRLYPERCYLQINGVYTFPDYLEGKTFADLKS
jgi:Dual OB-containing domain